MGSGDVVVCIDSTGNVALTTNKVYIIVEVDPIVVSKQGYRRFRLLNDSNFNGYYMEYRFVKLSDMREDSINKILDDEDK
jgi:hypothetical protein